MRAVVTALSAPTGAAGLAAAATLDYLSGGTQPALTSRDGHELVGYFADQTTEGPGRWLGTGIGRLGYVGTVDRRVVEALLRGEHPQTGEVLLSARGSNLRARAAQSRGPSSVSWDAPDYTMSEAAELVGVSDRYLRKIAGRTRTMLGQTGGDASSLATIERDGRAFLVAGQAADGRWRVSRDELLRFMTARQRANLTMGFDVTFSVPKSVSVLWAAADAQTRSVIMGAFERGIDAGVEYLERQGAVTGRGADRVRGRGFLAAAFTHATSRRLDPQLHAHVIVANAIETHEGTHRALDASALYLHARTAGYLAGAELARTLTERLGVAWRRVRTGIVEVDGVPQVALEAMSQRRRDIDELATQTGIDSPAGRRQLALRSRAPKHAASLDGLRIEWQARLDELGFDANAQRACLNRDVNSRSPTVEERAALIVRLVRHDGLTAHSSSFTRQEVIEAVADWSLNRLDAAGIEQLADELLADARVIDLAPRSHRRADAPRGRSLEPHFTTRTMVRAEVTVLRALAAARRPGVGRVDPALVVEHLATVPQLGDDQRHAVHALCRSDQRVQCLVGPAGSGKTFALRTAAEVWRADGRRVIGAAVQGTAAEHLQAATGIVTETVAAVLAAAERSGPHAVLDANTVLVVDEASAVGTFDLARLMAAVETTDAQAVLVGDPAQHSAVAAGGGFRALVRRAGPRAVRLSVSRRQDNASMQQVREAVEELRTRKTDVALHRLVVDGRIRDAGTRDDAYEELVTRWLTDRGTSKADGSPRRSCMITDDHRTRRALIACAREHLKARGELHGPTLRLGSQEFQAGDEVIARAPARDLHPPHARANFVRNGTPGRVLAVHDHPGSPPRLVVDFDGRGRIDVPLEVLTREVRSGVVGVLTHSYALTSHAAQGATFDTVHSFASVTTSPAGLYVAASRSREDLQLYTASAAADIGEVHSTRARPETGLQALARSVRGRGDDCFAVDRDPSLLIRVDAERTLGARLELETEVDLAVDRRPIGTRGREIEAASEAVAVDAQPVIEIV